jgi:hypothetical protein|tara:strand:- start:155 stop:262 length:108 start_codon:yes stop_codon:yes gene_type:complete
MKFMVGDTTHAPHGVEAGISVVSEFALIELFRRTG